MRCGIAKNLIPRINILTHEVQLVVKRLFLFQTMSNVVRQQITVLTQLQLAQTPEVALAVLVTRATLEMGWTLVPVSMSFFLDALLSHCSSPSFDEQNSPD